MSPRRDGRTLSGAAFLALLLVVSVVPVLATSDVLSAWEAYYPSSTLGTTYSCLLCHTGGSSMNPYGASIRDNWTGTVQQAFQTAQGLDPDGDGYTSLVEIQANTHPGDASSHPAGDTTPPSAPTNLTATAVSSMRIDLTWTASTDNVGVAHYKVYRGASVVAQPTATSWSDMGLSPATLYQYHVTAVDAASNESGSSNTTSATTLPLAVCDSSLGSVDVPTHMIRDATTPVSVAMHNTGSATWTLGSGFALGSQNPADNMTWGMNRAPLGAGDSIGMNGEKMFQFDVIAPHEVGEYSCDWQMVQDGGEGWFGDMASVTVQVTSYADVLMDNWAWSSVEAVSGAEIAKGFPGNPPLYQPMMSVTRDQMAVFFARALAGGDAAVPPGPAEATFSDVPIDHWAFPHIEYAVSLGVVAGYQDLLYHPELAVDRGQMAVFVARSIADPVGEAGLAGYTPPASPTFTDVPTDFWSYKHIEYIADPVRAVTGGYDDGLYHPEYLCNRDQMAVFIQRAFGLP